ncbi:hypothetical protein NG800_006685 [Epilithonimonas ginsengisoli]|uniref:TIGR04255 family protein n=1 Tax=Epilithonimonas ginsengisoli TaxID=1245592 RepID=A0ABU4JG43_9FLAO|nr:MULTISPECIES: hypothetical protein [Chryseobacterium group]MBV6879218.1 hypothetical protein [Epilithonimonas sp. FP105]MDW8548589.1 hypothetical protein [Epilithonimonas ginsengisoli]OAH75464.1 hypothetical protein AXA65_03790 [Chryseobacterium sp. FP211-J200]
MIYNLENVQQYLRFRIDSVQNIESKPWNYPLVQIKGLEIKFPDYHSFSNFLYCLKRQTDLGVESENVIKILDIKDIKHNIAFSNSFEIISNRPAEEGRLFQKDLDAFLRKSPRCFWGDYIDSEKVEVSLGRGYKKILEYTRAPKTDRDHRVLIQPPNHAYDESFIVYIQTDQKPNKPLNVAYVFEKIGDKLLHLKVLKNDWIY